MVEGTSRQGSRTNKAAQSKTRKGVNPVDDDEEYDKEIPIDEPLDPEEQLDRRCFSVPKQKRKPTSLSPQYSISDLNFNNGVEEGTSRQGSTNNATQSKTRRTRRRRSESPAYDDEEYDTETPDVEPVPLEQSKKKKKPISTSKQKKKSTPVSPTSPQYSISGFTFNNGGSGTMTNHNIGNIYNSTIEDAFNDNSVNLHGRRKPA